MINKISSKESSLFKYAKKLISKSNFRKREKKFIVEGFREIQHCKNSNFTIDQIFVLKDKLQSLSIKDLKINLITRELIEQIIYRESEGIFAIVNYKTSKISDLNIEKDDFFLVLQNPEKPGNIGAIMRTFEACGFKNIIITDSHTEVYNPNTIRASLGSIFSLNIFQLTATEAINFLKKNNFKIYGAHIESSIIYKDVDYNKRCALIMGPEKSKINDELLSECDNLINIPMFGNVDSLNLSVSTGIILYEAINQRKFS